MKKVAKKAPMAKKVMPMKAKQIGKMMGLKGMK